jgi:hypothetical protein
MGADWAYELQQKAEREQRMSGPKGELYRRSEREANTRPWYPGGPRSPYPDRPQDHRWYEGHGQNWSNNPQDSSQGRPYPPQKTGLPEWDARMDENRRKGKSKGGGKGKGEGFVKGKGDGKGGGKGKFQYRLPESANVKQVLGLLVAEQKHTSSLLKEIVRSELLVLELHDPELRTAFDIVRKEWQSAIPASGPHPVGPLKDLMWGLLSLKIAQLAGPSGTLSNNEALASLATAWALDDGGIVEAFMSLGNRSIKSGPPVAPGPWLFHLKLAYKSTEQQTFRAHLLDSPNSLNKLGIAIRADLVPTRDSERQLSGIKLY